LAILVPTKRLQSQIPKDVAYRYQKIPKDTKRCCIWELQLQLKPKPKPKNKIFARLLHANDKSSKWFHFRTVFLIVTNLNSKARTSKDKKALFILHYNNYSYWEFRCYSLKQK
jgi:hypothetical protein